jgi:membrane protease YdiL (CAAX protease family)
MLGSILNAESRLQRGVFTVENLGGERMRKTDGWIATAAWTGALALFLTVVTGGIWTALLLGNLATTPAIPWAAAVMALVLWSMWSYLGGKWGSARTRDARHRYLRARRVSGRVFGWALLAGTLSIVSLSGLWIVMFRLVRIPGNSVPDLSKYSLVTVVAILAMASLVSSVAEEAGFRGYFQGVLESRFRRPVAILIAALLISPAHGLTQGFLWPTLLFYFFVDTMLGTSACLTQSILPGVAIHTIGLSVFFGMVWPQDKHRQLIWVDGPDTWFWIHVAQAIVFAALGIMAFVHLARLASAKPAGAGTA